MQKDSESEDYWIGDEVIIISSGKKGIFLGINKEGKVRIKHGASVLLTKMSNIQIAPEVKESMPDLTEWLKQDEKRAPLATHANQKPQKRNINHSIDLHIEVLAPHLQGAKAGTILGYQMDACLEFIRKAYANQMPIITIIHGKGQGILKGEIQNLLKNLHYVSLVSEQRHGGALDVWLSV